MGADNDVGSVRMAEVLPGGAGQVPGPAAEGATPIDAGATADSEAPRPPAATVVQPETQAPRNPAASVLDDFLNTLVKLDSDAFFWEPVQEKDAPRYFDVVKHPMDIQTMRDKVHAGTYDSWAAFVADFELMCSNAMVYNQKRSRVHKTAVTMLRQGKKQLQVIDAEGQKAILALNPNAVPMPAPLANGHSTTAGSPADQPAVPGAAALGHPASTGLHKPPSKPPLKAPQKAGLRSPPKPHLPKKGPPPKKSRLAGHLLSGGRGSTFAEAAAAAAAAIPEAAWSDGEDCQLEHEDAPCCSSYSGTDLEDDAVPASTAEGPAASASPVVPVYAAQSCSESKSQAWDAAPSEAAALWRVRRRSAEWRAHWLELRLLDLAQQAHVYQCQLAALRAAPQQHQQQAQPQQPPATSPQQQQGAAGGEPAQGAAARAQPGFAPAVPAQPLHPGAAAAGQGHAAAAAQTAAPTLAEAGSRSATPVPAASARQPVSGPLEPLELRQPPTLQHREFEDARVRLVRPRDGQAVPMEGIELQVGQPAASLSKLHDQPHISVTASTLSTRPPMLQPLQGFPALPSSWPHTSVPSADPCGAGHIPGPQPSVPQQAVQVPSEPHAPPWEIPQGVPSDPRHPLQLAPPSVPVHPSPPAASQPQGPPSLGSQPAAAPLPPSEQQQQQQQQQQQLESAVDAWASRTGRPQPLVPAPARAGPSEAAELAGWQRLHHRRPRTEVPEFSPAMLLRHSFMAAQAGLKRNPQVVLEQEPDSQLAASHQLPVAIHASLELLDRQVDILARKLLQVPHSDHARGKGPRGPNRAGRGRGRGAPPQKRARPLGSIPSLDRHMARRKVDEEGMYGSGTPRHERLPVPDIKTPAVRAISDAELLQRNSSIAFFRSSSGMDGHLSRGPSRNVSSVAALVAELGAQTPALHPPDAPPGGVERAQEGPSRLPSGIPQGGPPRLPSGLPQGDLLNPLWEEGDEEGAGSSSEDTSDGFYQALHREFETQEQIKFGLQNAGGAQKKPPSHGQLKQTLEAKVQRQQQLAHASSAPPAFVPPPTCTSLGPVQTTLAGTVPVSAGSAPPHGVPPPHPAASAQLPIAPTGGAANGPSVEHHPPMASHLGSHPRPRGRPPGSQRGRGRGPGRPSGRGRAASAALKADGSGRGRSGRGRGRAAEPAAA